MGKLRHYHKSNEWVFQTCEVGALPSWRSKLRVNESVNKFKDILFSTSTESLYLLSVVKIFVWGILAILFGVQYQPQYPFFWLVNQEFFGYIMLATSAVSLYDEFWKTRFSYAIRFTFVFFDLFFLGFIAFGFILNAPNDAAWIRNFVETVFIGWMAYRLVRDKPKNCPSSGWIDE